MTSKSIEEITLANVVMDLISSHVALARLVTEQAMARPTDNTAALLNNFDQALDAVLKSMTTYANKPDQH